MEISEHSHTFWYVLRLVNIKNPGPLRFELKDSTVYSFLPLPQTSVLKQVWFPFNQLSVDPLC